MRIIGPIQFRTADAPETRQCQTKSPLGDLVCFKTCNLDLRFCQCSTVGRTDTPD